MKEMTSESVKERAKELGADLVGVASIEWWSAGEASGG